MGLANKLVVITGASSGIGASAARQLAAQGARVCLVARRAEELDKLRAQIEAEGGVAFCYPADLTDADAIDTLCAQIQEEQGAVDVLVNNAGRSIRRKLADALTRYHDYERTMQLNYFAAVKMSLNLLPAMLERDSGQIINVSSMSAIMPTPYYSAYVASKCALDGFSRSIGAELVDTGVHVTVINYPLVKTPMTAPTKHYKYMRQMDVDEAAGWIVDAAKKKPGRITSRLGAAWSVSTSALPTQTTKWTGRLFGYVAKRLEARAAREG